ncbi:lipopolysaccharide 1,6-galactosyltransferase [Limosilactobacillus walteri]|uniref:Lipopolysaccharide 1,6-galactosyltransferase n=1 Tax=Limosilactobacillus walteri TaxID=2268022 RepID=A0ABR8P5J8_9LACO|nr:lipopolysaccharide 1,6-galactosyltransferase [Limosilactobacillus walteri]MBD5805693.1 lipopolysaccharide 1,6-galactosyltransferase [Limosilactobacillus walteri]
MNLTFVTNKISGRGGTETVLVKVLNNLAENGDSVRLVLSNLTPNKEWLHNLNPSIKIIYPRNSSRFNRLLYFSRIFLTSPQNTNYVILSPNIIKLFAKLRKLTHKKCKLISWFHFSIANQHDYDPKNIKFADYHLAISSQIKEQIVDLGIEEQNVFLIYNPAEHHKLLNLKVNDEKKHLLYVGRIQKDGQKNLQELLHSLSLVDPSIILDIYGGGKDAEECKSLCNELGISNRVEWHGWAENVWDSLDNQPFSLILTSKFEGLPMVFLEAMSRGIPCISADFDGYDDVIKEYLNGTVYHLGNVKECAEKINKMAQTKFDPLKVQKSISKYYEEQYFNNLRNVLKKVINY